MTGPDLPGTTLVLASGNPGKLGELAALLEPLGLAVRPQSDWDVSEAVEDGASFVENALIKARHAAELTGLPAVADDSGLVVPALGGAPGIHSARYSESGKDEDNNLKLLKVMSGLSPDSRTAYFYCAMVMLRHADDPAPLVATARWWGEVIEEPSGENGFGYDPLFRVGGMDCTSAELAPAEKNRISHRGQAVAALVDALNH